MESWTHIWAAGIILGVALLLPGAATAQSTPAPAAEKELIAVLDLEGVDANESEVVALSDRLREVLLKTGHYTLVDRNQMDAVLEEQALQQTGCTSQECAVQVGAVLGVRKIVTGKVVKISDNAWLFSATIVDVETAETLRAESIRHRGDYFDLMDLRVAEMGALLSGVAAPAPTAAAVATAPAAQPAAEKPKPKIAIFPGRWTGQRYRGEEDQRWVLNTFKNVLEARDIAVKFTFYPDDTSGDTLQDFSDVRDDSWEGLLTKEPDGDFIYRKGRQLGVDAVLLFSFEFSGGTPPGSIQVYLFDIERLQVFERKGQWRSSKKHGSGTSGRDVAAVIAQVFDAYQQ